MEYSTARGLLVEAVEKVWRLQNFVENCRYLSTGPEARLAEVFSDQVAEMLDSLRARIELMTLSPKQPSGPDFTVSVRKTVSETLKKLSLVHIVLRYLHPLEPRPETAAFMSAVCNSTTREGDEQVIEPKITLTLFNEYNFGEVDVPAWLRTEYKKRGLVSPSLRGREAVVCVLPLIERANPLTWVLLVHELGHAIEAKYSIANNLCGNYVASGRVFGTFRDWIRELCADLIAVRLMGPAYLAAYASFTAFSESFRRSSLTHPPQDLRLWMMYSTLTGSGANGMDLNDGLIDYHWSRVSDRMRDEASPYGGAGAQAIMIEDHNVQTRCPRCGSLVNLELPVAISVEELRREIWRQLDSLLRPFEGGTLEKSRVLIETLKHLVPIGSSTQEAVGALREKVIAERAARPEKSDEAERRDAALKLLSMLKEFPSTPAEIINAGWIYKMEMWEDAKFDAILSGPRAFQDKMKDYGREMEIFDALLYRSLATAQIHRVLGSSE